MEPSRAARAARRASFFVAYMRLPVCSQVPVYRLLA
jgi:hypothetical protein